LNAVIWRDRRCKLLQSSASYCEGHEIFVDMCLDIYVGVCMCVRERERERDREREREREKVVRMSLPYKKKTQTHMFVLEPAFQWVGVFEISSR